MTMSMQVNGSVTEVANIVYSLEMALRPISAESAELVCHAVIQCLSEHIHFQSFMSGLDQIPVGPYYPNPVLLTLLFS